MTKNINQNERLKKESEIVSQSPAIQGILKTMDKAMTTLEETTGVSENRAIGMKTVGIADLINTNPAKAALLLDQFFNPSRVNIPDIDHPLLDSIQSELRKKEDSALMVWDLKSRNLETTPVSEFEKLTSVNRSLEDSYETPLNNWGSCNLAGDSYTDTPSTSVALMKAIGSAERLGIIDTDTATSEELADLSQNNDVVVIGSFGGCNLSSIKLQELMQVAQKQTISVIVHPESEIAKMSEILAMGGGVGLNCFNLDDFKKYEPSNEPLPKKEHFAASLFGKGAVPNKRKKK